MCSFLKWAQILQSGCIHIGDASQPPQELVVSSWSNFTKAQVLNGVMQAPEPFSFPSAPKDYGFL